MAKIVIACGGTGGHIYPANATAEELLSRDSNNKILFLGDFDRLPARMNSSFQIKRITSQPLTRKISLKLLGVPLNIIKGFFQAYAALKRFSPRVVFSTGGYASIPTVLAAKALFVPIILHEQNAVLGLANRIMSIFAKQVLLSFGNGAVGNPIRQEIWKTARDDALMRLGLKSSKPIILIMGGSQGSHSINKAVLEMLSLGLVPNDLQLVHLIGAQDFEFINRQAAGEKFIEVEEDALFRSKTYPNYYYSKYFSRMELLYAAADMAVSRSGAAALAEICACRIPSILIPYPYAAEDHQKVNARYAADRGLAILLKDSQLSGGLLADKIIWILKNKDKFEQAFSITPDLLNGKKAASFIADIICRNLK